MPDAYDDMVEHFFDEMLKNRETKDRLERYRTCSGRNSLWTCKDGTKIRIKDMTLTHLKNAIKMMERLEPTHEALKYFRYEVYFRENYNKVNSCLKEQERIADLVF